MSKLTDLLKSVIAVDENNELFIRLATGAPQGELTNAVNTQSNRSLETLLQGVIVLDENTMPALRVAEVKYGKTLEQFNKERIAKMTEEKAARVAKQAKEQAKLLAKSKKK